jgi:hypothetical protein
MSRPYDVCILCYLPIFSTMRDFRDQIMTNFMYFFYKGVNSLRIYRVEIYYDL